MRDERSGRRLIRRPVRISGPPPGRSRWVPLLALALLAGCESDEPVPETVVDPILWDSVPGLEAGDRVHVVSLRFDSSGEILDPDSLAIDAGDWVDFSTGDGSPRSVTFFPDSGGSPNRAYLDSIGLRASPPLTAEGSHWVLSFQGAPSGAYPFVVRGPGNEVRGVVHVGGGAG